VEQCVTDDLMVGQNGHAVAYTSPISMPAFEPQEDILNIQRDQLAKRYYGNCNR